MTYTAQKKKDRRSGPSALWGRSGEGDRTTTVLRDGPAWPSELRLWSMRQAFVPREGTQVENRMVPAALSGHSSKVELGSGGS